LTQKAQKGKENHIVATTDGCLVKTNKAALSSIIEKGSEHNGVLPNQSVWIFDAMALVQSLKNFP
jgi:hypothetical protein